MLWSDINLNLLERLEPFVVSHRANWHALDLAPLGVAIATSRRYDPTHLASAGVLEGLTRLDHLTFGDQGMGTPRWVLFDCGAFPGIVVGFGQRANSLPAPLIYAYGVRPSDAFVPLSMWVAVPCAEPGAWFGHNLSSANIGLPRHQRLPGLGTLTKALGLSVTRAARQYGATQWRSPALPLHLRFGPLHLRSAWTPTHTHPATLTYRLDVDPTRLRAVAGVEPPPSVPEGDRRIAVTNDAALHGLQVEIEGGDDWTLVGFSESEGQRCAELKRYPALPDGA